MKVIHRKNKTKKPLVFCSKATYKMASIVTGLIIAVLFSAIPTTVSNHSVFAESFQSQEDVTFTFVPTVNISISGDLIISDLATSSTSDSNQITVTTSSNNAVGYTLGSTVGNSSNASTELRKDGTSTTTIFSSITSNKTTLANFSDSNWGYSYSTDSGTTWRSGDITGTTQLGYNGLPVYTTSSPVKIINSNTNGSNSVKFKIGAKSSSSQTPGTYTNTINFIGVPKVIATTYTISYNDPSGEATNMPTQQGGTDTTGYGAINISSTQPTRTNYLFKGWCTAQTTDDTCSGDTIKPGHLLALNSGTSSMTPTVNKTLYAMWSDNTKPVYMQDMLASDCTTTARTVIDSRDGEEYLVQRLADGKCWLLDNLRLGGSSTINLTPDDTNITSNWTLPASTTSGFTDDTTGYTQPAVNTDYKNTTTTSYGAGSGKIGNYYNYCSASAGTYCYPDGGGTGNAEHDICPAGWRMPTGGDSGEYQALYTSYSSSATNFRNALSTPLSGVFSDGSADDQGSYGYFLSSTYNNNDSMYYLSVNSSDVSLTDYSFRYGGYSLKCVMDPTMQSVDSSTLASMLPNVGDTTTLEDERDGEEYLIGHLADGNYWMLDNLRLGGSSTMALTPADTNIASNFTLPASTTTGFDFDDSTSYTTAAVNADYKNTTTTSYGAGSGKIGNYYNYCSASAGTYCYARYSGTGNATHDICPAGWRMPTGGDSGEYRALFTSYSSSYTNFKNALSTPLSGNFNDGKANYQGSSGGFWSSTGYDDGSSMYSLDVASDDADPSYGYYRYYGISVRCLLGS